MSELLEWIRVQRSRVINTITKRHLSLAIEGVEHLTELYRAALDEDKTLMEKNIARISDAVREADKLRRAVVGELAMGDFAFSVREDMVHLSRGIDDLLDWTMAAARYIRAVPLNKLPKEMGELGVEMLGSTKDCVSALEKCVDALFKDLKKARDLTVEVEKLEQKVDEQIGEMRQWYGKIKYDKLTVGTVVMVFNLFRSIESISDRCEDVSDLISLLSIRYLIG